MVNNIPLETQKEALENSNKKTMQPVQASQNQVFNENSILDISGDKNTTTEKELPLNIDLSDNGNTLENTNNTTLSGNNAVLSPSNLKRILATDSMKTFTIRVNIKLVHFNANNFKCNYSYMYKYCITMTC